MATDELATKLANRLKVEGKEDENKKLRQYDDPLETFAHPYPEFSEFSRQIQQFEDIFKAFDQDKDGFLSLEELKVMQQKQGEPLTHLEMKSIMRVADEDNDNQLTMREFLLMLKKASLGELPNGSEFAKMVQTNEKFGSNIEVDKAGVGGAMNFFDAKAREDRDRENNKNECLEEQRKDYEKKREEKEANKVEQEKRASFKARAQQFE